MASYNSIAGNAGQRINFRIESLKLVRVNGFQDQYLRPYRTAMTNTVENNIREMTDQFNGRIPTSRISEACNDFIMPSDRVESYQGRSVSVAMPNGWKEHRYTFIMVVETTIDNLATRELVTGYTDRCDATYGQGGYGGTIHIAPDTVFYVNAVTKLSQRSVNGIVVPTVVNSYSVIGGGFSTDAYLGATTWRMTPQNMIQSARNSNVEGLSSIPPTGSAPIIGSDYRQVQNAAVLTNRNNNSPTNVFSKIIENMATSINADATSGMVDPIIAQDQVRAAVADPSIFNSIFMNSLYNYFSQRIACFDFGFLTQINPMIDQIMAVDDKGYQTTQYQGMWDKPTIESIMAVVVSNIVTSFMTSASLTSIEFTTTNMLPVMVGGAVSSFQTDTKISDVRGFNQTLAYRNFIPSYCQRLTDELGPIVSRNNNAGFSLYVRADMGIDIFIRLKYDNGIEEAFVFPMFADSIISPILTTNSDLFRHNSNDINAAMNIVTDVFDEKLFGGSSRQGWGTPMMGNNDNVNTAMNWGSPVQIPDNQKQHF